MDKLQLLFEQMGPNEKKQFLDDVNRYHLAISINTDPEFIVETTRELFSKYPFVEDYLESQL